MIRLLLTFAAASLSAPTIAKPSAVPAHDWSPDTVRWERASTDGTKFALLEGRRDVPGEAFSYAFFIPRGVWDAPHSHSATARVFLAKGVLRLGYGTKPDRQAARLYPAGSYLIVPAGALHFDGADEDTIIIGTASGPWSTTYPGEGTPTSAGTPID